ncbi:DUF4919 domain-containing protein [Muribaculaceae bacterium Isolate-002 (NCI)]|nr:DUF4919 domain-containing protein [Muribaculaceae bacterium Isolate-002 (NCI)]
MKNYDMNCLKTLILAAVAVLSVAGASAAGKAVAVKPTAVRPDMDMIKSEVLNPTSRFYYPKLMADYEKNDTLMTLEDYRYLYLGSVFQEDYNPYRRSPFDSEIEQLYYKKLHTRAEFDLIIEYAEQALLDDPFDLQQINFLIYALQNRGKINRAKIWQFRLNHLLEAILSTGTGLDTDNAWIVIDPKHEYNILNFKNNLAEDVTFTAPYYDYIKIRQDGESGDKTPEGYYFNIRYILEEYYRKHPEER